MPQREPSPRKSPEDWLQTSAAESGASAKERGRFKIFLGYAPGVGKTFSMLSEGIRRQRRGEDVVVGIVETHGRAGTSELANQLEHVALREIDYKGTLFTEMDVNAILARSPQVVLVDELAHTNIEGSRFAKRYEDVLTLLEERIDVLSTINIQHVESLTPRVQTLTGIPVREQVPDWVLDRADEIVISDVTPEALVTRMRRGDIYPAERVEHSLSNFFRRGNLIALREMALQRVTRAVDRTLEEYIKRKHLGPHWAVAEKIAVCISSGVQARDLIARGARLADALNAELYVLHVADRRDTDTERRRTLESNVAFATHLGARVITLPSGDTPRATATYICEHRITQAIMGRSATRGLRSYLSYRAMQKFLSAAPHVDLHIVTQESR